MAPRTTQPRHPSDPAVLRLLIADDHPAILDAVTSYVADEEGIEIAARASDGRQALELIERRAPDAAVIDIRMPHLGGIDVVRRLQELGDTTPVILYTGQPESSLLLDALDAGARGFLRKEAPLPDLMRAVRTVAGGGTYIDPLLAAVLAGPQAADRLVTLSKRERQILRMLADGMRNDRVARELSISPLTVQSHVKNAMDKLEADTRTQAVASALRLSLIT